jgi:hypothetical protein
LPAVAANVAVVLRFPPPLAAMVYLAGLAWFLLVFAFLDEYARR